MPPGPSTVSRRQAGYASRSAISLSSRSRPTNAVGCCGRLISLTLNAFWLRLGESDSRKKYRRNQQKDQHHRAAERKGRGYALRLKQPAANQRSDGVCQAHNRCTDTENRARI